MKKGSRARTLGTTKFIAIYWEETVKDMKMKEVERWEEYQRVVCQGSQKRRVYKDFNTAERSNKWTETCSSYGEKSSTLMNLVEVN